MKKIFIVTSGIYSDYGINAVFDSRELAEKYIASFDSSRFNPDIEEWELNPYKNDLTKGRIPFKLWMDREGEAKDITRCTSDYSFKYPCGFDRKKEYMYSYAFATDEKHAIKIANERRIQLIAENKW